MIIGFDVDGVLHHWHEDVYDYFVRERKYKNSYHKFWTEYIPTIQGTILMKNVVLNPTMYTHRSINTDYLNTLREFDKEGWEIWYISSVSGEIARDRIKWYKDNNLPQYENHKFVDGLSKRYAVKEAKCDYFVEDRIDTIVDLLGHVFVFIINQPWNEGFINDAPGKFLKISNVTVLPEHLLYKKEKNNV